MEHHTEHRDMTSFTLGEPSNIRTEQAPSQKAHECLLGKESFCARLANCGLLQSARKQRGLAAVDPPGRVELPPLAKHRALLPGNRPVPGMDRKFGRTHGKYLHAPCPPRHWPFDAEWFEESESDEVSGSGCEGPEEVLLQVSLLQGEVLVGFQAGAHLCRRVDVLFPQGLLAKVFVLDGHKAKGQKWVICCSQPRGTTHTRSCSACSTILCPTLPVPQCSPCFLARSSHTTLKFHRSLHPNCSLPSEGQQKRGQLY